MPRNLVLVGYRGSGKSTVGGLLAARWVYLFIDTDEYLQARFGRTIRDIFTEDSESRFRDLETQVLEQLQDETQMVLATGGSIVVRQVNRRLLRALGTVVWLSADAATLFQRVTDDPTRAGTRPSLIRGMTRAEFTAEWEQRQPLYQACADLMVDTAGKTPEQIADEIAACF